MGTEVDDFLEHYGKKGMKWGVVNNVQGAAKGAASSVGSAAKGAAGAVGAANDARKDRKSARKEVRGLRKEERGRRLDESEQQVQDKFDARYTKTKKDGSTGIRAVKLGFDAISGEMESQRSVDILESVGYGPGKTAAITLLGGVDGARAARSLKIRKEVKKQYAYA